MSDRIDKNIREAVSKRLREEKQFVFEGIDYYAEKTLDEFFSENDREDYIWEESLAESLYEESDEEITGDRAKEYKVGDIIMTTRFMSHGSYVDNSPHRILVITSKKSDNGIIEYRGFLLSSVMEKSNKRNKRFPNNIYIKPYNSILYKGAKSDKEEAFIRVDDLVTITNMDLSTRGSWKGAATWEFLQFVQDCVNNYKRGIDNSSIYWEK